MQIQRSVARICALCLAFAVGALQALADEPPSKRQLSDEELGRVTAGSASPGKTSEEIAFDLTRMTRSGSAIRAKGSMQLLETADFVNRSELVLSDSAQQNLSAIVNINAIDSQINVLLNLSITIDSTIGTTNQLNLSGTLPGQVGVPGP